MHSDQGVQFGSDALRRFCRSNHLDPSMSRKGDCWDNAGAESFFRSLKRERIKKRIFPSRELALADITEFVEKFYDCTRRQSYLGGISFEPFESAHKGG
jgi:putative transposase